jgi:hypothetical protein
MRTLSMVLAAALVTAVPTAVVAGPAHAKPPKPKAELVTKQPAAKFGSGKVAAGALVKNRGNKKAAASVASFYLSTDTRLSSNDTALGTARVGKLKAKKFKQVTGVFTVPASVSAGAYHVVVCADSGRAVKERKESNNCKGTKGTIQVTSTGPPTGAKVTISWTVAPLPLPGAVTGVASNGSCTTDPITGSGSCVVTAGVGTVTLTALPLLFQSWSGATCNGTPTANVMAFASPATDKACTATYGVI